MTTGQSLDDEMAAEGYTAGTPTPNPMALIPGFDIDCQVCQEARCGRCGHHGLDYRPFNAPGSYRAFAVCPKCDIAQEF